MNRKYSGFTLVEMLIVMGILIILMAVGITAGRFAINRANDVAHQNAADQIYTAMQAYYTDHREFPDPTAAAPDGISDGFGIAMATGGVLNEYMGDGEFTGGTDATFYYWADDLRQSILVCVSKGGQGDETLRGFYCTGNAFGAGASGIISKDVAANAAPDGVPGGTVTTFDVTQNWNADTKTWTAPAL
jgi:type II secretory pathway pseudopilin PulG